MSRTLMSIEKAAENAEVTISTIRNWIKTGYLSQMGDDYITKESFELFMEDIVGNEKLNARANKLQKDSHDHITVSKTVIDSMKVKGDYVGDDYESMLSDSYRNREGIYYTPDDVIFDMLSNAKIKDNDTFLDPCCGSGNFIIAAIKLGIKPCNIYGYDTDPTAVEITKKRIFQETGYKSHNIITCNFLNQAQTLIEKNIKFDLIFTNPPWGKKIHKERKKHYSSIYHAGSSLDSSSLFTFAGLELLNDGGYLGYLVPESFFNISSFKEVRERIFDYNVVKFVDYNKPFKGLMTKAFAFILENIAYNHMKIPCKINSSVHNRIRSTFISNPNLIINISTTQDDYKVLRRIYSKEHITLKNNASWSLGIVTGNNKKYCIPVPSPGYIPVYKGSDILRDGIKEPSIFIPEDFSNYQQAPNKEVYEVNKLIYKFISSKLVFYNDTDNRYILNSANMLVPDKNLGITFQQLTDLLNSDIMNWLFKKIFITNKVLRKDIELLPIHVEYFKKHKEFDESTYLDYLGLIDNGVNYLLQ